MEQPENSLSPLEVQSGEKPGVGLSLEDVRNLLATAHKTIVPRDDAVLLIVTIHNAYLAEVEKLHARHEKGLTKLMAEKSDAYVSGVHAAAAQLTESLSSASVEGVRKVFDDHAARLNAFKSNVSFLAAIVAVSALLNVAVFVLRGL